MLKLTVAALALLISASTSASTPAAWSRLEQDATRKCIAASEFRRPRVSNPIIFDDQTAIVALLVTGYYRQPGMSGKHGASLCLYDRRAATARLEEAPGWSSSGR